MGRAKFTINCDKCGKKFDELYGKGLFNRNMDNGDYCLKCYKKIFKEEFFDDIPDDIIKLMEESDERSD